MNLDEAQRKTVAEWVKQGLKLSEIQNRLAADLSVRLTYMEVRLLVDDLKLTPKDVEPPKPRQSALTAPTPPPAGNRAAAGQRPGGTSETAPPTGTPGNISVSVDQLARPGAVVSGKVTFSDGQEASWYFDQAGRLGLSAKQAGYRPSAPDLQQFQMLLETELSKMGF